MPNWGGGEGGFKAESTKSPSGKKGEQRQNGYKAASCPPGANNSKAVSSWAQQGI